MTDYLTTGLRHLLRYCKQKGHKSWRLLAFLLAFSVLLIAVFIAITLYGYRGEAQEDRALPRPITYTVVLPPSSQDAQLRVGEIHAHDEAPLGFRISGRLISRTVNVGDRVQAGQTLAAIESDITQNQLLSARADLDSARAGEQVAALNLRRMQQLMPSGAISRSSLDSAQAEWRSAAAKRKSAEASLKIADENVSWSRLIAPAGGVITAVNASVGQVVGVGESVAALAAGEARDAVFDVASPDEMTHNCGSPFTVSLLSASSIKTQAIFRDISPQANAKTRTWRVRLTLISPPPALALGAGVQAIFAGDAPPTMSLPASALTRSAGRPAVFVLDSIRMQLQLQPVTLAGFTATHIFVSDGVRPGNKVVIAGVSTLRAGEKVAPGDENE